MLRVDTESIARLARQPLIFYFKGRMYRISNTRYHGPPSCLRKIEAKLAQEELQHEKNLLSSMKVQHSHHSYELDEMPYRRSLSDFTRHGDLRNGRPVISLFRRIWQVRGLLRFFDT